MLLNRDDEPGQVAVLRLKFDPERSVDCEIWQLSEPKPSGGQVASVELAYSGPAIDARLLRATPVLEDVELLDGRELYEPALEVVATDEVAFGAHSLTLRGDEDQLWRLSHLLRMARSPAATSAAFLADDTERWAWARAALYFSGVVTPWIRLSDFDHEFAAARPIPDKILAVLTPDYFRSRATFFCGVGEQLLGPAGYGGQDLQGFSEVLRLVNHLVQEVEVCVVDPAACGRSISEGPTEGDDGFYAGVEEILAETGVLRVLA